MLNNFVLGGILMDKMTIWSILFVSFPEAILVVLTVLALTGYKDALNFKKIDIVLKLLLTASLFVAFIVFSRTISIMVAQAIILNLIFMYLLFAIVYRVNLLGLLLGVLLVMIISIVGDGVSFAFSKVFFNFGLEQVFKNDFYRFAIALPARLLQIILLYIVCKIRVLNFSIVKMSISEILKIILFFFILISSIVSLESVLRNSSNDILVLGKLCINILITFIFSFWIFYSMSKLQKKEYLKDSMKNIELQHIKQLLEEGKTDYVIQLLDQTLNDKLFLKK